MAEVVRFTSQAVMTVNRQAVYWKTRWADEWQRVPELWCREAIWVMAPSLSTAQIVYRYGEALEIGASQFTQRVNVDASRFYVRIDYWDFPLTADLAGVSGVAQNGEDTTTVRRWYGIVDAVLDEQHGPKLVADFDVVTGYPRGRDHYLAFGLEALLTQGWIDYSTIAGEQNGVKYVGRALPFNPGLAAYNTDPAETTGEGNRSTSYGPGGNSYVFHNRRTGGQKWTTRTAIEYELNYLPVRDANDEQQIPFVLEDPGVGVLPDWDEPILTREGRTTFTVLNSLIPRQRGLGWYASVRTSGDGVSNYVAIVPVTFLDVDLETSEGHDLPANPNQFTLAVERARGTTLTIRRIASDTVDQVVVRGERRTSTGTFSYVNYAVNGPSLAKGWPEALETEYEQAASTAADYPPPAKVDARGNMNWYCRLADKFTPVFSRHVLPDPFNGMLGGNDAVPLCPDDEDPTNPVPLAPDDQRFLPRLALLEGYTYHGDAIDSGNIPEFDTAKPHVHQKPLVVFPRENLATGDNKQRYRLADKRPPEIAPEEDLGEQGLWTAHVRIDDDDGALWVSVENGKQMLLAKEDFTPLADADDQVTDELPADFRQMLATLTVQWSAFAEARYPEELGPDADLVRRMLITVPYHRVDYVAPRTVVGLDEKTGELLKSDAGGFIRDDRDKLRDIARLAHQWYGAIRKSISLETTLVNNLLEIGDLIVSVGDPTILGNVQTGNISSVITMIRISSPLGEDAQPPPPVIEYQTDFGELDVLHLVPRARQR